jgi:hypothetical protein
VSATAAVLGLAGLIASSPARSTDMAALVDALAAGVRILGRPIDTYHCAARDRVGLPTRGVLDVRPAALGLYLESKLARYWDEGIPVQPHAMVSGLFAGIEPVTCRHFAGIGDSWALVRIRLPRGLAFLDVREEGRGAAERLRFTPAVQAGIEARGCDARTPALLVVGLESKACRRLALTALRRLGVGAILADFPAFAFARCPASGNGVFILLHADRSGLGDVVLFTAERPGDDPLRDERRQIREVHARARAAGSIRVPPWPELPGSPPPSETDPWMDQHLWGCGANALEPGNAALSAPGAGDHVPKGSPPE